MIVGIIGGSVLGVVLLCGGCCVGGYFFFTNHLTSGVRRALADNPVIQEHIGDIESLELDFAASMDHAGDDVFIFRIEGSKGAGLLTAACLEDGAGGFDVLWGELKLDSGETVELAPENDVFTPQVRSKIETHPVIVERIGAIAEFTTDWDSSMDEEGADVYVFRIRGDKGAGTLRAECITVSDEEEDVVSGELILESGEKLQLFPEKPLN
jgi:hypothetical protein